MSLQTGMEMQLQSFSMTTVSCLASVPLLQLLSAHLTGISICPSDFPIRADIQVITNSKLFVSCFYLLHRDLDPGLPTSKNERINLFLCS